MSVQSIWGSTDRGPATGTMRFPVDTGASSSPGYLTITETATFMWASPNLVTPALGTPASGTMTNCTGYTVAHLSGAGTGALTALGVNVGSAGAFVVNGGDAGTPSALVGTNITGTAASLTAGSVSTLILASTYSFAGTNAGNGSTAANNTGFGYHALNSLTSGTQNTCFGVNAGDSITSAGSSPMSCFGYNSGDGATGANSTYIGAGAGNASTSGTQNTAVGDTSGPQSALSNTAALGYGAQPIANNAVELGNGSITSFRVGRVSVGTISGGVFTLATGLVAGNGVTATTQTAGDNSTKLATTAYVDQGAAINTQSGDYTLALTDANKFVDMTKGTATVLTIPANGSIAFPVGTEVTIRQGGAGQVTVAITSDTLNNPGATLKTRVQYSQFTIKKMASTTWTIIGDAAAS